jgi:hypothetical protein
LSGLGLDVEPARLDLTWLGLTCYSNEPDQLDSAHLIKKRAYEQLELVCLACQPDEDECM